MQGPRLSSHYDRAVPDLTVHLAGPPVKSAPDGSVSPAHPRRSSTRRQQSPSDSIASAPRLDRPPSDSIASAPRLDRPPSSRLADDDDERDEIERSNDSETLKCDLPKRSRQHPATLPNLGKRPSDDGEGGDAPPRDAVGFKQKVWATLKRHAAFVGPGVVASIAYLDPGNWSTDLQAGSAYGYSHLFIVLLSGLMALFFQILATRLGCVSDEDYASHCRIALYDRDSKYKMFYRWGLLYPLWVLCEIGIIFTDLAELLGSAIAINLLIPAIPLWGCVLITAGDVLLILLLFNQYPTRTVTRSMRMFELLIGLLVLVVLGSFVALLVEVSPKWKDVFHGYVPSSGVVNNGGIYIAVGIIGATVMPHAFFIGSKMACMRRLPPSAYGDADDDRPEDDDAYYYERDKDRDAPAEETTKPRYFFMPSLHLPQPFKMSQAGFEFVSTPRIPMDEIAATTGDDDDDGCSNPVAAEQQKKKKKKKTKERQRSKPSLNCVRAHLTHACFDVAGSLLGFALVVNSAILILAAAVFYYGEGKDSSTRGEGISDLFDAYALVRQYLGQALAYIFAIALLAAGQSASLTVTLAGQLIGEGMLRWRTKPWKRRLITRLIGIVPSLAISVGVGRAGISTLLVASQVALSIVLTFVLPALIVFTSEHRVMAIPIPGYVAPPPPPSFEVEHERPSRRARARALLTTLNPIRKRRLPPGALATYASPPIVVYLCWMIWLLISIANVYALYTLAHGEA